MGGRGSSSGISAGAATSKKIKDEALQKGLNSKFKGVRRDAENGTGNYSFRNAEAIGYNKAKNMDPLKVHERNGNTLVEGLVNGRHVVYGNKTDSKEIKQLKDKIASKRDKHEERQEDIRTTTTYDRWHKRNQKNFESWFNGGR